MKASEEEEKEMKRNEIAAIKLAKEQRLNETLESINRHREEQNTQAKLRLCVCVCVCVFACVKLTLTIMNSDKNIIN